MAILLLAAGLHPQIVVINEVMSANDTTLQDGDGDYPDWLELINGTDTTINLSGYGLSDDRLIPLKWVLLETTLRLGAMAGCC